MPFSKTATHNEKYWTRHYEQFLKPLIEKEGKITAKRSEPLRGSLSNEIILDLIQSDVVIADLTDHNPNVFLELGIRLSFKHGTITIAEEDTSIPFDIKHKSILFYNPDHMENHLFEKNFLKALNDVINNQGKTDSPVLESITGRNTLYSLIHKEEILRKIDGCICEVNENLYIINDWKKSIKKYKKIFAFEYKIHIYTLTNLLTERYLELNNEEFIALNKILTEITATHEVQIEYQNKELNEKDIKTFRTRYNNIELLNKSLLKILEREKNNMLNQK